MDRESNYISLQDATKFCDYTQEYLSLRARQGKLKAVKFGRNWVTKEDWLKEYLGKVEEYGNHINNGFKINRLGIVAPEVASLERLGRVPENLPVEADEETVVKIKLNQSPKFSLPALRPIFSLGLFFILLAASVSFGKEELLQTFEAADSFVAEIVEKSDVALKEVLLASRSSLGEGWDSGKTILTFGREGTEIVFSDIIKETKESFTKIDSRVAEASDAVREDFKYYFSLIKSKYLATNNFAEKKIVVAGTGVENLVSNFGNQDFKIQVPKVKIEKNKIKVVISDIVSESALSVASVIEDISSFTYAVGAKGDEFLAGGKESLIDVSYSVTAVVSDLDFGVAQIGEGGNKNLKDYFSWLARLTFGAVEKISQGYARVNEFTERKLVDLKQNYFSANNFIEVKIADAGTGTGNLVSNIRNKVLKIADQVSRVGKFVSSPWKLLPSGVAEVKKEDLEKIQQQVDVLETRAGKETVKTVEVSRITQVEPIKEITKQILTVDSAALAQVRAQLVDMENSIGNRLYAPGGVISQQIYIKEPVASPKVYQENGDIVLQTVGTGNVVLSAATGMQISGKQVVIDSTSVSNPLVYIADPLKVNGRLDAGIITGTWQGTEIAYNFGGTGTTTALALQNLWWGDGTGKLVQVASSTLAGAAAGADTDWIISGTTMYATDTISYLGIGTTTPSSLLELSSATSTQLTITVATSTYDPQIVFKTGIAPAARFSLGVDQSDSNKFKIATSTLGTNDILIIDSGTGYVAVGTSTAATLFSIATSTNIFNVTSAGTVGIGTTTPGYTLSVVGNIYGSGNAIFGGTLSMATTTITGDLLPSANTTYNIGSSVYKWANIYAATGTFGGTIVINTDTISATSSLTIIAASTTLISSANTLTASSSQAMIFNTAGSERMRILSTGEVGIGTTTPATTLGVYGTSTFMGGYVGIGTTTPAYTLDVNGTFRVVSTSTLGAIASGTWQGTAIGAQYGGTGMTTYSRGDILFATSTTALFRLATGTEGQVLTISSGIPAWAAAAGGADTDWIISGTTMYATTTVGYVGIGTTTAGAILDIYASSTATALTVTQNQTGNIVEFKDAGTSVFTISDGGYAALAVNASTTPSFLVKALGVSPTFSTSTYFGIGATSTFVGNFAEFLWDATSTFKVDQSGNLYVAGAMKNVATKIVAATSTQNSAFRADYVCAGASCEDEINQAINALPAGGGVVYLLEGTYNISTSSGAYPYGIQIATSNVALIGSGKATILRRGWNAANTTGVITVGDAGTTTIESVLISNLQIDGLKASYASNENSGIFFNGRVTKSKIEKNWFKNNGKGVYLLGYIGTSYPSRENLILGNYFEGDGYMSIGLGSDANDNIISGNTMSGLTTYGIQISYADRNSVIGNFIYDFGNSYSGIQLDSGAEDNLIASNYIYDTSSAYGINNGGVSTYMIGNQITGMSKIIDTGTSNITQQSYLFEIKQTSATVTSTVLTVSQSSTRGGYAAIITGGRVGIETATPFEKLEVGGGLRLGLAPITYTTTSQAIGGGASTTIPVASTVGYPSAGTILIDSEAFTYATTTATAFGGAIRGVLGTATSTHAANTQVKNYLFTAIATSTTPRMVILGDGSVGIGTTTPTALLDVWASSSATALAVTQLGTGNIVQFIGGLATSTVTITNLGRVGIATSSPARMLEVLDVASAQMRITQSGSQYSEFQVDVNGDLTVSAAGGDIQILNENLWVCELGSCGISISGVGNLVVENSSYFAGNKMMYPSALGQPKRSIILTSAGAITPTSLGASQTKVDGTNHTYYILSYSDATTSSAYWQWVIPDSFATATAATSAVDVTFYWEATSTSGDVMWQITTAGVKPDSAEDIDSALGNTATTTDTAQGNADDLGSVTISNYINAWEPNDYIIFNVSRLGTNAADTLTATARLVSVKIEYSVKQEGD